MADNNITNNVQQQEGEAVVDESLAESCSVGDEELQITKAEETLLMLPKAEEGETQQSQPEVSAEEEAEIMMDVTTTEATAAVVDVKVEGVGEMVAIENNEEVTAKEVVDEGGVTENVVKEENTATENASEVEHTKKENEILQEENVDDEEGIKTEKIDNEENYIEKVDNEVTTATEKIDNKDITATENGVDESINGESTPDNGSDVDLHPDDATLFAEDIDDKSTEPKQDAEKDCEDSANAVKSSVAGKRKRPADLGGDDADDDDDATNDTATNDRKRAKQTRTKYVVELRLIIPAIVAGTFIGKAGSVIKKLRTDFKVQLNLPDSKGFERIINVKAKTIEDAARFAGEAAKRVHERLNLQCQPSIRMLVHQTQAGSIIGTKGHMINKLRNKTGADIGLMKVTCPKSTDRVCKIKAPRNTIVSCVNTIMGLMKKSPPRGLINNYCPNNRDSSYDYGGYNLKDPVVEDFEESREDQHAFAQHSSQQWQHEQQLLLQLQQQKELEHEALQQHKEWQQHLQQRRSRRDGMQQFTSQRGGVSGLRLSGSSGRSGVDLRRSQHHGRMIGGYSQQDRNAQPLRSGQRMSRHEASMRRVNNNIRPRFDDFPKRFQDIDDYSNTFRDGSGIGGTRYSNLGGGSDPYGAGPSMDSYRRGDGGLAAAAAGLDDGFSFATKTTQVTIPSHMAGAIVGFQGQRIRQIKIDSGADIKIEREQEAMGSKLRVITIVGDEEQTQNAEYLLKRAITQHSGGSGQPHARR